MTTVESRVLNPVTNRATSIETVNVTDNEIVDTALKEAEESKILEDEEIDSCEGDDLEEQMLNVALVKSVVDSGSQKKPPSPTRYGLRKRRRPGDSARAEPGESDPNTTIKGGREAQRLAAGGIKGLNQVGSTALDSLQPTLTPYHSLLAACCPSASQAAPLDEDSNGLQRGGAAPM